MDNHTTIVQNFWLDNSFSVELKAHLDRGEDFAWYIRILTACRLLLLPDSQIEQAEEAVLRT